MLNTCIRCSSLFVGLFSLVQALIWAAGSIWGISVYDCTASYPLYHKSNDTVHNLGNSVSYLFYVSYLRGSCANPGLNYVAPTAEESYKLMMAYSIISSLWIPTSVMLLVGSCLGARGGKAMWIYFPWLIVTLACCVLDVYATIKYGIDIGNSMTSTDYIHSLSFPNDEVKKALGFGKTTGLDGISFVPAIIMTVIACRVVVLWIVNLFFIIFGLQGICAFYKKLPPKIPPPYHEYEQEMNKKEFKNEEQHHEFRRPEAVPNHIPNLHPVPPQDAIDHEQGRTNSAFVLGEPLRLNPVEVEVKQERINPIQYAEVEDIELEPTPPEIRRTIPEVVHFPDSEPEEDDHDRVKHFNSKLEKLKQLGLIVPITNAAEPELTEPQAVDEKRGGFLELDPVADLSEGESSSIAPAKVESTNEIHVASAPPPETDQEEQDEPRRVYDVNGNPTDERLTPRVARLQKIFDAHSKNLSKDLNGFNTKPFSYTQPHQPQVDTVPKKNDTIRGIDKPPIPVPDYSVRVSKKTSFRTPLPNTE